jgi:hypothetical protein
MNAKQPVNTIDERLVFSLGFELKLSSKLFYLFAEGDRD